MTSNPSNFKFVEQLDKLEYIELLANLNFLNKTKRKQPSLSIQEMAIFTLT